MLHMLDVRVCMGLPLVIRRRLFLRGSGFRGPAVVEEAEAADSRRQPRRVRRRLHVREVRPGGDGPSGFLHQGPVNDPLDGSLVPFFLFVSSKKSTILRLTTV